MLFVIKKFANAALFFIHYIDHALNLNPKALTLEA